MKALGMTSSRQVRVSAEGQHMRGVSLQGASPNLAEITNTQVAFGRMYTETENRRRIPVAVIGADVKENSSFRTWIQREKLYILMAVRSKWWAQRSRWGVCLDNPKTIL